MKAQPTQPEQLRGESYVSQGSTEGVKSRSSQRATATPPLFHLCLGPRSGPTGGLVYRSGVTFVSSVVPAVGWRLARWHGQVKSPPDKDAIPEGVEKERRSQRLQGQSPKESETQETESHKTIHSTWLVERDGKVKVSGCPAKTCPVIDRTVKVAGKVAQPTSHCGQCRLESLFSWPLQAHRGLLRKRWLFTPQGCEILREFRV